jgi:aerobic-type carbon monoxide dehydrogenase small subunit (CoxS/CutS family)
MARRSDDDAPPPSRPVLSRRGFLGSSAAVGVSLGAAAQAAPKKDALPVAAADGAKVRLVVNGAAHELTVEPRATLADTLREKLGLTGTKVVCDRGACSACTVFLDGTPVVSCLTLAIEAQGKNITTIEGVARDDDLHPVQAAFIEHDAMQCGFCTPGMVMSCVHLVDNHPSPTLDDVKLATSGNLCRCGTYPKVFAATLQAAAAKRKG